MTTDSAAPAAATAPGPSLFELAGAVLAQVEADVASGVLPRWPAGFAELHDHTDANQRYLLDIVPNQPPVAEEFGTPEQAAWDAYTARCERVCCLADVWIAASAAPRPIAW